MKRMMAISGLVFLFFVLFHAYGNLHYFEGEIAYDHYAHFLRTLLQPIRKKFILSLLLLIFNFY